MTVLRVGTNSPVFRFNTADLIGGDHFTGSLGYLGAMAYNVDTNEWFTIKSDGTLAAYSIPVSFSGDVVLSAGSNVIGKVGIDQTTFGVTNAVTMVKSLTVQPTMSPALTVAGAYGIADYVGTSAAPISFPGCSAIAGSGGYILGAELIDAASQNASMELWLFDSTVTVPDDNAAWTVSDADLKKLVCVIPFSTYYASAANSVSLAAPDSGPCRFVCGAAVQTLFGALVTRSAKTWATGELTVRLTIVQD